MSADVRKLLASHRQSRRVSSPYATYSLAGALFCNACGNMAIKSESLWDAHAKTPQHRANVANKPPPPQPTARAAAKRPKGPEQQDEGREGKRVKMSSGGSANLSLPQGFFDDVGVTIDDDDDDDDDDDEVGEKADGVDGTTPMTTSRQPPPLVEEKKAADDKPLPTDFFDKSGGAAAAGAGDSLDDEWAAFQADIAETEQEHASTTTTIANTAAATGTGTIAAPVASHTISVAPMSAEESAAAVAAAEEKRNVEQEEKEEDQDRMAEFFDEQSNLEERVRALKERRERLRSGMVGVESTSTTETKTEQVELPRRYSAMEVDDEGKAEGSSTKMDINTGDDGGGDEDEDEEDESDEEDMYDLWSMGGRLR